MNKHVKVWQLQEAKAKFSELVRRAQTEGPQLVSVNGKIAVEVKSARRSALKPRPMSGAEFLKALQAGPAVDFEIPDWETEGEFRDVEF